MSLNFRRYRYLIPIAIIFIGILIYFGEIRIFSINFGEHGIEKSDMTDIDNSIDLFDTTTVHDIQILMSENEYNDMINTYSETEEKDRYKTDVIIDGVTIYNVGVRLKGNSSLNSLTSQGEHGGEGRPGGEGGIGGGPNGMEGGMHNPGTDNLGNNIKTGGNNNINNGENLIDKNSNELNDNNEDSENSNEESREERILTSDGDLPLLIKFNKYVDQTYQGHEQLSIRVSGFSNDDTMLSESYAYSVFQEMGYPAPDTAYAQVKIGGKDYSLFIISEIVHDPYYIQKRFGDDNGIMYKAGNFIDFEYIGDDPTLYTDSFTQETRLNDYDLSPLIKLLKFVTNSSDEEFAEGIENYIDVDSVLTLLAIDDILGNTDSFGSWGSNYYLYYNLTEEKFYLLTWDQNMSFNGMGIGGNMGGFGGGMLGNMSGGNIIENNIAHGGEMSSGGEFNGDIIWPLTGDRMEGNNKNLPSENLGGLSGDKNNGGPNGIRGEGGINQMNGMGNNMENLKGEMKGGEGKIGGGGDSRSGNNILKTRLMANEKFLARYNEIYKQVKQLISSDFSDDFFEKWSSTFLTRNDESNFMSEESYLKAVESMKSYLEQKGSSSNE